MNLQVDKNLYGDNVDGHDDDIYEQIKYETDPQVIQLLNDVVNFRLGQTIDEVRANAVILSGIAAPSSVQQAVCVKFIFIKSLLYDGFDNKEMLDNIP